VLAAVVAGVAAALSGPVGAAVSVLTATAALAFLLGRMARRAAGCAPRAERIGTVLSAALGATGFLTIVMGGVWWLFGRVGGGNPDWLALPAASLAAFIAGAATYRAVAADGARDSG
jgi:hypothetical protein